MDVIMSRNGIRSRVASHPRATAAAFTLLFLLTQAQSVLAEGGGAHGG